MSFASLVLPERSVVWIDYGIGQLLVRQQNLYIQFMI